MSCVFGPVPSRRLGLSLGVDLIPPKTCTYDCLYCQVGKTDRLTLTPQAFVPVHQVGEEVKKKLESTDPDVVTLAGSGEPTLYVRIHQVISAIKKITPKNVVLLTNGSLLWRKEIRERVLGADIVMPTLTSVFNNTFKRIHRPHPDLDLDRIVEGLKKFRKEYKGQMFLELVLLAGINDTEEEVSGLKKVINRISPDKIQLNTVTRPPSDAEAESLDIIKLREIMHYFGEKAEIVANGPLMGRGHEKDSMADQVLEMIKRRPLKSIDISTALNISAQETEDLVNGLLFKGKIRKQMHSGKTYYVTKYNQT